MEYVKILNIKRDRLLDQYTDLVNRHNLTEQEMYMKKNIMQQIMYLDCEMEEAQE
ncbi:hypothetical protein IZY60_08860 [Lutibacter sp. B2]|nr:hypothetical protein [Lutibacter sp. B2]